ncbi:hypothetical protein HaLaN_05340 [Haematococcus lacustris]|uniref:Uncharacterized protein n=1 Tax=Haematococcus lacustris TaxID=44745 RepID=A0A699YUI1_HAELA|nr:hypothetical protein HaLaN_05340 [Haematococcus lacustris]
MEGCTGQGWEGSGWAWEAWGWCPDSSRDTQASADREAACHEAPQRVKRCCGSRGRPIHRGHLCATPGSSMSAVTSKAPAILHLLWPFYSQCATSWCFTHTLTCWQHGSCGAVHTAADRPGGAGCGAGPPRHQNSPAQQALAMVASSPHALPPSAQRIPRPTAQAQSAFSTGQPAEPVYQQIGTRHQDGDTLDQLNVEPTTSCPDHLARLLSSSSVVTGWPGPLPAKPSSEHSSTAGASSGLGYTSGRSSSNSFRGRGKVPGKSTGQDGKGSSTARPKDEALVNSLAHVAQALCAVLGRQEKGLIMNRLISTCKAEGAWVGAHEECLFRAPTCTAQLNTQDWRLQNPYVDCVYCCVHRARELE